MKRSNIIWTAGILLAGAALSLLDALVLEKFFFEIKTYDIGNKGSRKKLKLMLLADLHFKEKLWPHYRKLAEKINELQPDLIMITGDTLDRTGKTHPMIKFFNLLDHDIRKVAIPGNHDYKAAASISTLQHIYQAHNCSFLRNETSAFHLKGTELLISGIDDFIEGNENLKAAVENVGRGKHHFLLIHSPLQQEPLRKQIREINQSRTPDRQLNISYIFAGHNHGGQITILGYAPKLPVKSGNYVSGWYNEEEPFLYVSKGFGTTTVPLRFGARAELTLFNYYV